MQVFVEDEKLREFFKCVPELKRAKIFAADPLESRFHLLKNQRYTNRTEVLLEPDALYIRPVRAHPHIPSPPPPYRRKPGRFASDLPSPPSHSLSLVQSTQWFGQQGNGRGNPALYQTRPCYAHGIWVPSPTPSSPQCAAWVPRTTSHVDSVCAEC